MNWYSKEKINMHAQVHKDGKKCPKTPLSGNTSTRALYINKSATIIILGVSFILFTYFHRAGRAFQQLLKHFLVLFILFKYGL